MASNRALHPIRDFEGVTKIRDFVGNLEELLSEQKEYNHKRRKEREVARELNELSQMLEEAIADLEHILGLPTERLWVAHSLLEQDSLTPLTLRLYSESFIKQITVKGHAARAEKRFKQTLERSAEVLEEVRDRIRESWEQKLPELLRVQIEPSYEAFDGAVPFEDEILAKL